MGRGTNSATAKSRSLDAASTFEQVKQYAAQNGIIIGDSLSGNYLEGLKEAVYGIEAAIKEYPNIPQQLVSMQHGEYRPNTYAFAQYDGGVYFPNKWWETAENFDSLLNSYADDVRDHYHPSGSTVRDLAAHEVGHLIERTLIDMDVAARVRNGERIQYRNIETIKQWNSRKQATSVIAEACREVQKTSYGVGKKFDDLIGSVSEYALKNRSEALAECVCDYSANGRNANPLSVKVHDILVRRLSQGVI